MTGTQIEKILEKDPIFSPEEAARYIGSKNGSPALLNKLRCYGGGPVFLKIGKSVKYRKSALDAWLASRERQSTSDAGQAVTAGAEA